MDVIGAIAEEKALFLVVEDAHWMDEESWELLSHVAERMVRLKAVLLVTTRPTAQRPPTRSTNPAVPMVVRLHPLSHDESAVVVRTMSTTGAVPMSPETEQWMVSASEGNPLYLQALVNHWISTGDRSGVPPTLQALLDHRLGQLPPTALRVLQTITLLGPYASLDRVVEVLRLPTNDLLDALEQLENSGCLNSSDATLVISHELIARAAMGHITTLVCATLRSAIADLFEREHADAGDNRFLLEALHHLEQSGRRDTVLRFFLKHEEAMTTYGRPRELLRALDRVTASDRATPASAGTPLMERLQRLRARLEYNSGEYQRFLALQNSGQHALADFNAISVEDAEHALAIAKSCLRTAVNVDFAELARITQHIAKAVHLPSATRIQAVETGLIIATESLDSALATALMESVTASGSAPIANDKLSVSTMMYNTIFGSLDVAHQLAESLLANALANENSTAGFRQIYNASNALRVTGPLERAIAGYTASFRMATEMDAARLAEDAAWQLAIVYRALGDNQQADRWTTCLETLCESADNEIASNANISHRCQVAILERKADRAGELLIQSRRILVPSPRSLADQAFLELGTSLLDPHWVPDEALLTVARTHYDRHSWHGFSDFFALTFFSALERAQRLPEAISLATEYLTVRRRERTAVHVCLQRWIDERTR
jgi:tetratricopeptide (TPR) repeat protein